MTNYARVRLVVLVTTLVAALGLVRAQQVAPPSIPPAVRAATLEQVVPVDPLITVGMLPNGMRYYVRENRQPAARAELRLAVKAGSVLEDEDQRGIAHFVEHMAFNGTTNFPGNAVGTFMQSLGVRFGAHVGRLRKRRRFHGEQRRDAQQRERAQRAQTHAQVDRRARRGMFEFVAAHARERSHDTEFATPAERVFADSPVRRQRELGARHRNARRVEREDAPILNRAPLLRLELMARLGVRGERRRGDDRLAERDRAAGREASAALVFLEPVLPAARRGHRRKERAPRAVERALRALDPQRRLLRPFVVVERESNRLARGLTEVGVTRGDRVSIYLPASEVLRWITAYAAVHKAGGVVVPTNTRLTVPELVTILGHAEATVMLTCDDLLDTARDVASEVESITTIVTAGSDPDEPRLRAWDESGAIRWMRLAEPSIPRAMNDALEAAASGLVLFFDDDLIPGANIVAAHVNAHKDDATWAVAGQVLQPGEEPIWSAAATTPLWLSR